MTIYQCALCVFVCLSILAVVSSQSDDYKSAESLLDTYNTASRMDSNIKRFGYMGSRGKRQSPSTVLRAMGDLLDLYNERLRRAIRKSQFTEDDFSDFSSYKNKRQPHLGFHGSRG